MAVVVLAIVLLIIGLATLFYDKFAADWVASWRDYGSSLKQSDETESGDEFVFNLGRDYVENDS